MGKIWKNQHLSWENRGKLLEKPTFFNRTIPMFDGTHQLHMGDFPLAGWDKRDKPAS